MKMEVKSAALGGRKLEKEKNQVFGMDGIPLTEADLAEEAAWERELHWLHFRLWPGWTVLGAVAQVIVLMGLFVYSGPLLRLIDPTCAALDPGILSGLLLSVLLVDAFVVSAWLLLRLVRSTLMECYEWDDEQNDVKKGISACLEIKLLTGIFSGLVLLFFTVFLVLL